MEIEELTFSQVLRAYFYQSGMSLRQLSAHSWLDLGYVSRLIHQEYDPLNKTADNDQKVKHPSRDTVIRLGLAMKLPLEDIDSLLLAAGYAPLVR